MRKLLAFFPAWPALALLLAGFASTGACSAPAAVQAGGECLTATDCADGLVCVPSGGKRICSADLTGIVSLPPEGGAGDATVRDTGLDAIIYDAPVVDSPPPPKDTGTPDVSPPQDSGGSQDSGGGG